MIAYQIGDRVLCTEKHDGNMNIVNEVGTIICEERSGLSGKIVRYGVEFDNYIAAHDCGGRAKYGHGYYIPPEKLQPIFQERFDPVPADEITSWLFEEE